MNGPGPGELQSVAGWGDPRTVICLELQNGGSQRFHNHREGP